MSQVTAAQIKAIAGPGARSDLVAAIVKGWPVAVTKAKLTTRNRAAHFLAQIMTETGGLQILEESGAYRAARILEIFGAKHSARIGPAEAARIAALPLAQRGPVLFNRVYGVGNPKKMREFNNTGPNDGWLYRGGGMMQATGKSNYAAMEKKTGLPLVAHPEMLHNPDSAFMAAYLEWAQDGRCNAAADRDDTPAVRHIINGGTNGLAECKKFVAKTKSVLANYQASPPVAAFAEPEPIEPEPEPAPTAPAAAPVAIDTEVLGDPELFSVQKRLKARNYSPGVLDGLWGSGTAGALGGFINDRGGHIAVPASLDAFNAVREDIKAELGRAEGDGWVRPVSDARKAGDSATVAAVAPEVVPVKQNRLLTIWGAIGTTFAGIYKTFSDTISNAWDSISEGFGSLFGFVTDHKDDIPTDPSFLQTAWGYVTSIPSEIWIFAAAIGLVVLAVKAHGAVKKITESVQTGARQ
jgi:predicted chitinase